MNAVQDMVDSELWQDAATYVVDKGRYVSITQLQEEEKDDDCSDDEDQRVLYGLVLSIKKPKTDGAKKIQYLKQGKTLSTYNRLVLLRELQTGQGFYVVAPEPEDSFHLFRFPDIPFLGSWVAIYEPQSSGTIHSLPLISTSTTLIPIEVSPDTTEIRLTSILDATTLKEPVKTFLLEVPARDVRLGKVGLPTACTASMCDSLHKSSPTDTTNSKCPALVGGRSGKRCLTCNVTIKGFPIKKCPYSSETLANLLISKEVLQAEKVDLDQVREKVKKLVVNLADEGASFICGGWFKHAITPSAESSEAPKQRRNVHISVFRPKMMPPTIGLITLEEARETPRPANPPRATLSRAIVQSRMPRFMTPNQAQDDHFISSDEDPIAGPSGCQQNKKAKRDKTPGIVLSTFTAPRTAKPNTVDAQDETPNEDDTDNELPSVEKE